MFDRHWYLETYPDVAASGLDAATHFLETGWLEGRDPGPEFSSNAYLRANRDVGRSGINPLLHFIEFGQFEGREIRGRQFPRWRKTTVVHDFGPAAPIFRGSIEQQASGPWRSWHRLSQNERLFSIGGWSVGYVDDPARAALDGAFEYLRTLSGYADDSEADAAPGFDEYGSASLIDAWLVNEATLRTRWRDAQLPFVVRAFQHDGSRDGAIALVADEVILSPLDILDISLRDRFSPILLVFAEPDGRARGAQLLAFPSLCRGGLHYPELLAASGRDSVPNAMPFGRSLAERLLVARKADDRCISAISLDSTGADGTSPLMHPQFAGWLKRVAAVEIESSSAPGKAGTLVLASDMIPTIGLLASRAEKASRNASFPGLLITNPDPSEPALLVQLPPGTPQVIASGAPGYAAPWPSLSGSWPAPAGQPGAIRLAAERELTDAELLMPTMNDPVPPASQRASITWIVEAAHSTFGEMADWAMALSMQPEAFSHVIASIGKTDPEEGGALARLFGGDVRCCANVADAVRSAETDFIGYLGRGVVLHDPRTCTVLVSVLRDFAVVSASCVLVDAEVHGKTWHVSIVDAGRMIPEAGHSEAGDVQQFWRSSYPVERPPLDFWLARTATAREWFGRTPPAHLEGGIHLCTSLVTASLSRDRRRDPIVVPPKARADRVTRIEALFG